jgi:hypothetical protein
VGLAALTHSHLLLCEGRHDKEFFDHLLIQHNLPPFQTASFGFVGGAPANRDGIDYLDKALNAIVGIPGFRLLQAILIVADNDDNPPAAFQKVQHLIRAAAAHPYPVPTAELAKALGQPSIVVMMLPWTGLRGALDTLCLSSASNKRSTIATAVENFATVTGASAWPAPKDSKMKLRSLLSAAHQEDPYLSPAWVWREGTDLVPLNDPVFDQIVDFLRNFSAFLARS